ncbi:uptake hydrogenase HoxC [Niveispirillum sp. SYP-B3756]|uniref:uptake hydrogenase HoxC n=1 Tax=Niveispirillum sp. SYP-B3756 TaxID=2662178 RepID=UPI0012910EFA|nr:uptake hydrogenase HoxC [Niveispirillum sp. SYP-B3756]MQP67831.1 uptake hydrogenase HoxC [Niveispirillum sp. SYP-B3756]
MGEPRLTIHVQGDKVRIGHWPGTGRERLLVGRTPDEALRLVILLHNLCPSAHRLAALLALGRQPRPDDERLLAQEILGEHALVMLRDWPVALGLSPDGAALRGLGALTPDRLLRLERDLFGMPAAQFLLIDDIGPHAAPAGPIAMFRLVADWPVPPGPGPVAADPTYFARCTDDPLIASEQARGGVTLALRMLARLREAARLIVELTTGHHAPRFRAGVDGVGVVEAARGRLIHRVRVEGGIIQAYTIETPTGAMGGPDGFLQHLLTAALAAPAGLREKVLAIALSAADPCLPVQVEREAA